MIRSSICRLVLILVVITSGDLYGQQTTSSGPGTDPKLSAALQRWNQMSPEQRNAILKVHNALQQLPANKRENLIERVRELEPSKSKDLVRKVDRFLKSPAEEQKKVRRRGIAFRLWKWDLNETERENFRKLAPPARGEFLRSIIKAKEKQLLLRLTEEERVRLLQLPNHVRWEALNLRHNRRRLPDSPRIQRVLHLAHRLNRQEMNQFVDTALAPAGHPALEKAVRSLSNQEKDWISKFLRRGPKRNGANKDSIERKGRGAGPGSHDRPPRRDGTGRGNRPGPRAQEGPDSPQIRLPGPPPPRRHDRALPARGKPPAPVQGGPRNPALLRQGEPDSVLIDGEIFYPDHLA
ncbi:MAG: DUF3106 domain-containing protein [Planctomycetota bacterium]|nr:DUF3106 domain-containing protein [Planctomycetota bacterium]